MNNGMRSLEELLAVWRQVEENIEGLFVLSEEAILELFRSTCRCILGDAHWHANAGRGALEAVVNRTAMRLNANYKNPIIQRWPSLLRFASASHWNDTNLRVILRGDATKTFAFNFLGHEGPVAIVRLEIMVQNIDWKPAIALSDFVRDILEDIGQPGQEFRASLDLASRNAFDMLRCRILWGSHFHKDLANELLKLPQVRRDVIVKELSEDLSSERVPSGGIPPMDLELYRFLTSHFLSDVLLNAPDLDIRWIDEIIDLWMTVEANFSDPIDSLLEATDNPSFLVRVVLRMLARMRDVSECVLMTAKVGHCLKSAIEHDREHGSYRSGLAEILEVLGLEIFPEFPFVARECVLSAFSMSPTKERLGRIEEFTFFPETTSSCESSSTERLNGASFPPVMAPRCTQAMDPGGLSEHRSTLEFGSLINGSEGCETTPMSFEEAAEGLQEALVTHEPCVIGHDTRALCSVFGYRVSRSAQFRPASSSAKFVESNHIVDALMNGLGIVSEQLIFDVIALIDDCRDHCLSWTLGSKDLLRACEEYLIRDVCREMGVHSPVYSLPPSPAASSDIVSSPDRLTYDGMESGFDDSSIFSDDSSVEGYDGDGDDEVTLESDFADRSVAEASEIEDEASVEERWIAPEHEIQSGHSKPSSIPAESSEPEIETMEVTEAVSDDGHGWDQPSTSAAILEPPVKRRRGRPPKLPQKVLSEAFDSSGSPRPEKPARGRFSEPSTDNLQEGISQESVAQPGRGRGRPKKNVPKFGKEPTPPRQDKPASPLMPPPSSVVVRTTRGRPPKVSKRELKNVSDSEEDVKEPPDPRKKKRHKAEPRASTEEVLFRVDSDSGLESGATSERGESVGAVDSHSPGKRPKIAKVLKTRRLTVPPEATPMLPSMSTASGKTLDDGWEFSFVNPSERRQGLTEKVTDLPLDVTQRSKQSSFAEQIRHSQSRSYTIVATALTTAAASSTTGNASGVLDGAGNGESGNGSGVNDDGSSTHGNELAANSFGSDAAGNGVCSLSSGSDGQITTTSSVIKARTFFSSHVTDSDSHAGSLPIGSR